MLILIVPAIIVIILFVVAYLVRKNLYYDVDVAFILRFIAGIFIAIILGASIPAFIVNQCADATTTSYRIQYETLVYQLENGGYDNPINYSCKDLMNDIYNYNSNVESGRILSKNPWISVYYPGDWDNLPLIRLEDYK